MTKMELKFNANLINEGFARNTISSFVMFLNPTIDEIIEIKTIVSEAVTNAIIHGYSNNPEKEITIRAQVINRTLELEIIDEGIGITNIEKAKQPLYSSLKTIEHAGMGLSIIETLADEFDITSSNLGTKLMIKKTFKDNNAS